MTGRHPRILVLGLGNDILGDDAVGLLAARRLRALVPESIDIREAAGGGLELLDLLEGYDCALLLDSIVTRNHASGTIHEFSSADFPKAVASSPHYAGIPELLQMAEQLEIAFPKSIRILAVEVADPYQIREGLSASVTQALPALVMRARQVLESWLPALTRDSL